MSTQVVSQPEVASTTPETQTQTPEITNEKVEEYKWGGSTFRHDEYLDANFTTPNLKILVDESLLLAAGGAAILLQVAHPGVGAGVNEFSNFAYRAMDRLRTTLTFVYTIAYGTREEKEFVTNAVTTIHRSVVGTLKYGKDKGKQYTALDPELQKWVQSTLYATGVILYEDVLGKLDDKQADAIYDEFSRVATSLQVPPEMWPATRQAFWEYWDHMINTLEVTQDAKDIAHDLLYKARVPLWIRPGMPTVRIITAELIPERLRTAYGLKRRPKVYKALLSVAKVLYPPLPLFVRHGLVNHYLKDMRKRIKSHRQVFGSPKTEKSGEMV